MANASDGSSCAVQDTGVMSAPGQVPKFGMLIPNRVFVGGITSTTTEAELKQFFSTFGPVKDCKIILDRAGVSKGLVRGEQSGGAKFLAGMFLANYKRWKSKKFNEMLQRHENSASDLHVSYFRNLAILLRHCKQYGFVTFEQLEDAEKLMKREGEHILFKDRKLNIGPAIRKQQNVSRIFDSPAAVGAIPAAGITSPAAAAAAMLYAAGGVPYSFPTTGLAMLQPSVSAAGMATPTAVSLSHDSYASLAATALPHMVGTPQMIVPQQSVGHLTQQPATATAAAVAANASAYYQQQMAAAAAAASAAAVGSNSVQWATLPAAAGQQFWPWLSTGVGVANQWLMAAASGTAGTLPLTNTSAGASQLYSPFAAASDAATAAVLQANGLTAAQHDVLYGASTAGSPYQTAVDLNDTAAQLVSARTNDTGLLLDSGSTQIGSAGAVQYLDVQYAAAAAGLGPASSMSQEIVGAQPGIQRAAAAAAAAAASQNYGVKRVLAVPRQVICTSPTSYGLYAGSTGAVVPPPVKIVAGIGGQRMVTKTVSPNEIQIIPKTQN